MSQAIERAIDIIDCFRETDTLCLTDLSNRTGHTLSTVHRIVAVLKRRSVLVRDPQSQRFTIGPDMVALAARANPDAQLQALASPLLTALSESSGETAVLSLLVGSQRVAIKQCESTHQLRRRVELGHPLELHYGSAGKAMLAHLDDELREQLLRELPLKGQTPFTLNDRSKLQAELDGIRKRGYATSKNEYLIGVTSIGSPVFNGAGRVIAAISVTGPLSRLTSNRYARVGADVAGIATKLTYALSHKAGDDPCSRDSRADIV